MPTHAHRPSTADPAGRPLPPPLTPNSARPSDRRATKKMVLTGEIRSNLVSAEVVTWTQTCSRSRDLRPLQSAFFLSSVKCRLQPLVRIQGDGGESRETGSENAALRESEGDRSRRLTRRVVAVVRIGSQCSSLRWPREFLASDSHYPIATALTPLAPRCVAHDDSRPPPDPAPSTHFIELKKKTFVTGVYVCFSTMSSFMSQPQRSEGLS